MDRTARTFLARLLDMAAAAGSAATAAITAAAVSLAATKTPAVSWLAGSDLRWERRRQRIGRGREETTQSARQQRDGVWVEQTGLVISLVPRCRLGGPQPKR